VSRTKWAAVAALLVSVGAIIVAFFTMRVCDQQVASTGSIVEVCRHPNVTDPPIVAIGAVAIALLGAFFAEVSGFGFTLKRAVEAAQSTAENAAREVRETRQSINDMREHLRAEIVEEWARQAGSSLERQAVEAAKAPRRGRNVRITPDRFEQLERMLSYPSSRKELLKYAEIIEGLSDEGLRSLYVLADDMLWSIETGRRIGQSAATLRGLTELTDQGLVQPSPNYPDDPGFVTLSAKGERLGRLLTAQGERPSELANLAERIDSVIAAESPTF